MSGSIPMTSPGVHIRVLMRRLHGLAVFDVDQWRPIFRVLELLFGLDLPKMPVVAAEDIVRAISPAIHCLLALIYLELHLAHG